MSSGTPVDPYAATRIINGPAGTAAAQGGTDSQDVNAAFGLSNRQLGLNHLWAFYRCQQYDSRKVDWDGVQTTDHLEREVIASSGYIPAGFEDVSGSTLPLSFRKPVSPYHIVRIIVDRFTGLLFSKKRAPKINVIGDLLTEDWVREMAKVGDLWSQWVHARTYGGAMGSVAVGFSLVNGKPRFEVHDPRWSIPTFEDRFDQTLELFEKRYVFPREVRNYDGKWETRWFWYRRVITKTTDSEWPAVPQDQWDGEPDWDRCDPKIVEHDLGVCPVVWVQNFKVDDDIDGDPDCQGIYETASTIDALMSQAFVGVRANCDPTFIVQTPDQMPWPLQKGSGNAIHLTEGSAQYLEITGAGPKSAVELAKELRGQAYEVAACVPDDTTNGGPAQTATEITTRLSRMLERADVLRDQYGKAITRLLNIAVWACRRAMEPKLVEETLDDGAIRLRTVEGQVYLPPKAVPQADGTVALVERALGPGGVLELEWPSFMEATLDEAGKAATAVSAAIQAGTLDAESGANFLAKFFGVKDVPAMLKRAEESQKALGEAMRQTSGW